MARSKTRRGQVGSTGPRPGPIERGPSASGSRAEKPGDDAMKPAQAGMIVGLAVALIGGILIGARYGTFMLLVGGLAGLVAVVVLVPVAIGLLTFTCRLVGIDPHLMEERIALLATWGIAVTAALVSVAWILGPR